MQYDLRHIFLWLLLAALACALYREGLGLVVLPLGLLAIFCAEFRGEKQRIFAAGLFSLLWILVSWAVDVAVPQPDASARRQPDAEATQMIPTSGNLWVDRHFSQE